MQERIKELVNNIFEAEKEIEQIKYEYELEKSRDELKQLLMESTEPNEKGQHLVIVDGLQAMAYVNKGYRILNTEKARRLLHPNTFNAITKVTKESKQLRITQSK